MMRICSATDLGLPPWTRRSSSSDTLASNWLMVFFKPEMASSVMGAIVKICGREERVMDEEKCVDGETEKWGKGRITEPNARGSEHGQE